MKIIQKIREFISFSPSRVFTELGDKTTEGFIKGLEQNRSIPNELICDCGMLDFDCPICRKRFDYYLPKLTEIASNMKYPIMFTIEKDTEVRNV